MYAVRHFNHAVRHDQWEALDRSKVSRAPRGGGSASAIHAICTVSASAVVWLPRSQALRYVQVSMV